MPATNAWWNHFEFHGVNAETLIPDVNPERGQWMIHFSTNDQRGYKCQYRYVEVSKLLQTSVWMGGSGLHQPAASLLECQQMQLRVAEQFWSHI